ncbi:MAG: prepilin-type N-terminal cleavage/methylation domain-containing protein [Polyangia bacterium]
MRGRQRSRGVTLVELMMSLVVIVVGMLAIFRVISTSVVATSTSSRVSQAQARSSTIIEAIRLAPAAAITCLKATAVSGWATCEVTCKNSQTAPGTASPSSCIFTANGVGGFATLRGPNTGAAFGAPVQTQQYDRLGQQYFLNTNITAPTAGTASAAYGGTYVRGAGDSLRTLEIAITTCWNDDNSTNSTNASAATTYPNHCVTLVTGMLDPTATPI